MFNEIESLTLGSGVTSIGQSAFGGNKLTNLTIPSNVENLGVGAFVTGQLNSVCVKGKEASTEFDTYPDSTPFGWADGYSDSNITWNCTD